MTASPLLHFLLSLLWMMSTAAHSRDDSTELSFPPGAIRRGLSLSQVQAVLHTEASIEFGDHNTTTTASSHAETMWEEAVKDAWQGLKEEEQRRLQASIFLNATENTAAQVPFMVCDTHFKELERSDCVHTLLQDPTAVMPLYNKMDMACFQVRCNTTLLSPDTLPIGLVASPYLPEMKMERGLAERIARASPMVSRIELMFCVGVTKTLQNATDLGWTLANAAFGQASDHPESHSRRLERRNRFLESRMLRESSRAEFWHRQLQGVDTDRCRDMMLHMRVHASDANTVLLTFPLLRKVYRDCMMALVVDLSLQPQVCYIGAYQQIQVNNVLASSLVQGGNGRFTPFDDVGLNGRGQVVAVSDTGLDVDNCYMWDRNRAVVRDRSGKVDLRARKVVQYYAFSDARDNEAGHGTHVAGSIAGRRAVDGRTETDGAADGVARQAKLAVFDIGNRAGALVLPGAELLFDQGYDSAGARIHSASWGSPQQNAYTSFDANVDRYMYTHPDFLFVVAAGNSGVGDESNSISSPAVCKNGLSVGASENAYPHIYAQMKGPNYVAGFSGRGPTADGRMKPDVVAPGMFILSARAVPDTTGECDDTNDQGTYFSRGTSMATPIVAGTAALIRQYFLEGWHVSGMMNRTAGFNPRSSLVKAVLINGAQALKGVEDDTGNTFISTPYDKNQGFGRVNLLTSVPLHDRNNLKAIFVNSRDISTREVHTYTITIDKSNDCWDPLSVSLVWTDPPGSPFCNKGCVLNDLDLYLIRTGGANQQRLYPNGLDRADTTNNAERIQVVNPAHAAEYTIHVAGSLILGSQAYSLVATGCFQKSHGLGQLSQSTSCPDKDGKIAVDPGRLEDCKWLAANKASYNYLCDFLDVAVRCPSTCSSCSSLELFKTSSTTNVPVTADLGVNGKVRWFGNMFDIQTTSDVIVHGFDVHISSTGPVRVQVFTHPGKTTATTEEWRLVCDSVIEASGLLKTSTLPDSDCVPVKVDQRTSQTFYVTVIDLPSMIMTVGPMTTEPFYDDGIISIHQGFAVSYLNAGSFPGYNFNGGVRYSLANSKSTSTACIDRPGTVFIDDSVGQRSCIWLKDNFARFKHVCAYAAPALHCPLTCDICGLTVL